jgi:hypothetical protein
VAESFSTGYEQLWFSDCATPTLADIPPLFDKVRKTQCLRAILYAKCIILPRQARDQHRENTQKKSGVFL